MKVFMRAWIFILIFICCIGLHFPQELNFRNLDVEHGLVQATINCILEDSNGFIWFGTYGGGLSRFNGRNFETFDRTQGLTNELIFSIFEDQYQQLWIGTYSGVFRFDGNKFEYMDPANGFPEGQVFAITGKRDGKIYFADTIKGVVIYDNGTLLDTPELSLLSKKSVISLFLENLGTLWIGTSEGLYKYSGSELEKVNINTAREELNILKIFMDSSGRLWIGSSNNGLHLYNNSEWRSITKKYGLPSLSIQAIHESSDGLIRIGTKEGLVVFTDNSFSLLTEKEGLINNFISAITQDRENNIWIGTNGGVSKQLNWFPFRRYSTGSGIKDNSIWSFFEDNSGNILISSNKGIDIISSETGKVLSQTLPYSDETFYPMINDRSGNTWLCSNNKILQIINNRIINTYSDWEKQFEFFYDIYQDHKGRIWFATQPASIILYENGKFSQFSVDDFFDVTAVFSIIGDKKDNIWFGSDKGIFYFNGREFTRNEKLNDLNKLSITKILIDKDEKFWVGTYAGGLFKIDPEKTLPVIRKFDYPSKLPEKNIVSMTFDNSGDLWVGSNVGFFRLNLAKNSKGTDQYQYFSGKVGIKGLKCNENSIFKDRNGNIWVGTQTGAIVFDPKKINRSFPDPIIHITDVELFLGNKEIDEYCNGFKPGTNLPEKLELPYNENHLSFSFMGITSAIPKKVKYRWKLGPVDSHWSSPSNQEQITYSNLASGDYKFEVQCSTNIQNWDVPVALFKFSITSPFWRSNIFQYLSAFILLGLLLLGYYYKSTRMKEREGDLQEKIRERTEELLIEKNKVEIINRDLEERVIERTNELEQKNMELIQAQKLEIIGSLAGGVAHDLNNILSGVVSYPDLLLKTIDEKDPNRKYIEIIKDSGEKAAEMVQDLLTLTRKGVINKEPISVNEIIKDFFNSPVFTKLKKNNSHINYTSDLTTEKTSIFGSSIHITKTIMNLIINASEAMPIDGTISISTNRCYLDEPLKGYDRVNEGDYIKLSIKDNGIGIDKKDLSNIFEPFFSKKRMGKSGTGLGMTVVLWTIKDHYGYVIVNSIKGKGTEFQLYFPAAMYDLEEEKKIPESEINTAHIGKGEHILIIEDDENNRELAEKILSECNFRVSSVSSGEEAVEFVEKEKVDLLILDMIMGGIDGLETYIQILMRKGEQKAIITSGYSDNENVKETIKLGAGAYIKKPYLKMQLIKAVESELRKI
ncbi:MAG: two-component regulator propeller domain-containing protein [Acidobacteriota bacterium]